VRCVRRSAVLALAALAATTGVVGFGAEPAWAHICPVPVQIPVGQLSTVAVGVTVEGATVPDVTITFPPALRLDRVDAKAGWTETRAGSNTVHARGGPIAAYTCEYFSFGVTASSRGAVGITVVQRDVAGKVVATSIGDPKSAQSRVLDQIVYAGVSIPSNGGGSSGPSTVVLVATGLIGVGVVLGVFLAVRAWRDRRVDIDDDGDDTDPDADAGGRDAELQARLDRFRKRPRDAPPR
jgi:hypothetical protein